MGMYYHVTGWISYGDGAEGTVARRAIATAAEQHPKQNYATQVAASWKFVGEPYGFGVNLSVWNGAVQDLSIVRSQVEAVAAVLRPAPDGYRGWSLVGHFDVTSDYDDWEPVEWRVYGGAVHEAAREVPPYGTPGTLVQP